MSIPTVTLNGVSLSMRAASFRKKWVTKGKTEFELFADFDEDIKKVRFPNFQMMEHLTSKFLKCEYIEPYRRGKATMIFLLDSNLTKEDRVAFLGAVCVHTAPIRKKPVA